MKPEDVLRYIGQFVDPSRARYFQTTKEIDNPDPDPVERKLNPKISVTVETWKMPDSDEIIFEGYRQPGADSFTALTQATPKNPRSSNNPPQEKDENGRRWVWNPTLNDGKGAWADVGPAPETPEEAARNKRTYGKPYKNSQDRWVRDVTDAQGRVTTENVPDNAIPQEKPDAPREFTFPDGSKGIWVQDANAPGGWRPEKVAERGAAKPLGSLPADTHLGTVARAVQAKLDEIYADPNLSEKEKLDRATLMVNAGDALLKETQSTLAAQQNAYTNQTTLRGQDLTETQSRRAFSQNVWDTSYKQAMELNKYQPAGSTTGFDAMLGQMLLGTGFAAANGGMRDVPQPTMPQGMQQAQGLGLPGMPSINITVGAPAPASVQAATQPPPAPAAAPMPASPMPSPTPAPTPEDAQMNSQYPGWLSGMMSA